MNKKKNIFAKVVAFIALLAIIIGIVGTGALVILTSFSEPEYEASEVDIEQYLESLSGSTVVESDGVKIETTDISSEDISEEDSSEELLDRDQDIEVNTTKENLDEQTTLEADIEVNPEVNIESEADVIETLLPGE